VQVCSLQTLHARPHERPAADLVIIDEAHRAVATSVRGVLRAYPSARILGLTATPARSDGRPLGDVFERLVEGPSTAWLIENGYLVPCDVIAPPAYVERGLFADPVEAYQRHAPRARAIVFAASVAHAESLAEKFTAAGVPAECITGETSRAVRRGVRDRITAGDLRVLVGVSVFLEGFDCPSIDCVILARGFGVTGAFLQAIGRGLRPSPETGKTKCTVIDLRGAVHLHGLPDEARSWSLTGEAVRRTEALAAVAHCRECLALFRPASRCPRCGARLGVVTRLPRNLSRAEKLEKVSALPPSTRDLRYFAQLERVARVRLRLPPEAASRWALGKFRTRFGREPMFEVTQ
jgi:DNA repair protein RadD